MGRLAQVSDVATRRMAYDGDALVEEYDGSGTLLRRFVHGPGVDDPLAWYEGSTLADRRFLHADHQGSVVAVSDASGDASAINKYDEYGVPQSGFIGRFGYTGQAWVPELELWYYKARFYGPRAEIGGRFLQVDPVGYDDQVNLYAYVGNDPINSTDPTGQQDTSVERAIDRDIQARLHGEIDDEEYLDRLQWRGFGAAAGLGIVLTGGQIIRLAPALLRVTGIAFRQAVQRYPQQLQQNLRMGTKQLKDSIKSFQRNVDEHVDKLNNPSKHVKNWNSLSKQHQASLRQRWRNDIKRNEAYKEIAEGVVKSRRSCTGTRLCPLDE